MDQILLLSPAYNEAKYLEKFADACHSLAKQHASSVTIKLHIVNDGSTDETLNVLKALETRFGGFLGWTSLARNFGHQSAIAAGLVAVDEWPDAVVTLDADLEHPLELVPDLISMWQQTRSPVVNTIRQSDERLPLTKRFFSAAFYRFVRVMTGLSIQNGQADFRLWDANVVRSLKNYLPNIASIRLLAAWIAPRAPSLDYRQFVQPDRVSRFTFKKNIAFALNSILRFSEAPILAMLAISSIGIFAAFAYGLWVIIAFLKGAAISGWASTVLVGLFFGSLNLMSVATLSLYLSRLQFRLSLPPFVIQHSSQRISSGK